MRIAIGDALDTKKVAARLFAVAVAVAVAGVVAVGIFTFSTSATAGPVVGPICPGDGGTMSLNGGERCVWPYHSNLQYIEFRNRVTPVLKCAILKPYSDGSGGNIAGIAPCAPELVTARADYITCLISGYQVGLNQSGNLHSGFRGYIDTYYCGT